MRTIEQHKAQVVTRVAELASRSDEEFRQALDSMWAEAFEEGRLAALDEFQDRFCTCMKS